MCGRYTLTTNIFGIKKLFVAESSPDLAEWKPRYNIAPTQLAPVVIQEEGHRHVKLMKWGLIPFWAKDASIGSKMINARSETIQEKPAFKNAFRKRRCIVPVDGFYEWKASGKKKVPYRVSMRDQGTFGFAGLWESWRSPEDGKTIETYTVITTQANSFMKDIHDRMPVILDQSQYSHWLDPEKQDLKQDLEDLQTLLQPFSPTRMQAHPVSKLVNSPSNDVAECILPITEEEPSTESVKRQTKDAST